MATIKLLERTYTAEELCDVPHDVDDSFDPEFNPGVMEIPCDEYGSPKGTFTVSIVWNGGE